jgi:alkylation response protein AidB-like acyl-CoA dehydrogenase
MYERKKESLTNEISAEVFMKAGQVAEDVTGLCTKKLGGYGLTRDYPVAQRENDAKLYQIGGGTADVRKHIVGCKMLPEYAALFKAMIGWYAQQPA